jgi:CsoR family transcriptional regulator, copper-sensing transcriptional repressor
VRIEEDAAQEAVRRLRRIEGQVAGITRMIDSGRDCQDVITQISAASNALDQVGFRLLASGLRHCLTGQDADEDGAAVELERLFLKLA